jgi:predicted O-methyltransferase YrrM
MGGPPAAALVSSVERVRQARQRLLASPQLFPVAIGLREGEALRDCIRKEGARRTLEVGLGWGVSTLFICEGLLENGAGIEHVACDPYQFESPKSEGAGIGALEEAGVRDLAFVRTALRAEAPFSFAVPRRTAARVVASPRDGKAGEGVPA